MAVSYWFDVPCKEWDGGHTTAGYSLYSIKGYKQYVHRIVWEIERGKIPRNMTIDHLCRNPGCIEIEHLDCVSMYENLMRGDSPPAVHRRQTHCIRGHEFSLENSYINPKSGNRTCIACRSMFASKRQEMARL